jgi:hypothetical protein
VEEETIPARFRWGAAFSAAPGTRLTSPTIAIAIEMVWVRLPHAERLSPIHVFAIQVRRRRWDAEVGIGNIAAAPLLG